MNIGLVYRVATFHLTGTLLANGALVANTAATFVLPQSILRRHGGLAGPHRRSRVETGIRRRLCRLEIEPNPRYSPFQRRAAALSTKLAKRLYHHGRHRISLAEYAGHARLGCGSTGRVYESTDSNPRSYLQPRSSSANSHIPSVGIGLACHANGSFLGLLRCGELGIGPLKPQLFAIDLAYQAAFYEVRTVTGTRTRASMAAYDTLIHAGSLSLRFNY